MPLRWPSCEDYSARLSLPSRQRVAGANPAGRASQVRPGKAQASKIILGLSIADWHAKAARPLPWNTHCCPRVIRLV